MNKTSWLLRAFARLPLPAVRVLAWLAGQVLWYGSRFRKVCRVNLGICYPDLSPSQRDAMARQSLVEFACAGLEFPAIWNWPVEKIAAEVTAVHGRQHLEQACSEGAGVILAMPHFGAWEWVSNALPSLVAGKELLYLYKPHEDTQASTLLTDSRGRAGGIPVPASTAGLRRLLRSLAEGGLAVILPDQRPQGGDGEFVPFFGHPALTQPLVHNLVQRTNCRVVFMALQRLPRGQGFELHFLPADEEIYDPSRTVALTALNRGVERCIAIEPRQYMWAYKRFGQRHAEPRYYK